jgi:cbb3-type cytochrome c oxidase subunit II
MKMTPRIIVIGGLAVVLSVVAVVVFLPAAIFRPADSLYARPYSALEEEGRALYVSNGCMYCHSQFTRPDDVVPGKPAEAGAYNYDRPHQLGTIRTGPDLYNIGLKRGDEWEIAHLRKPRELTPNSIMPEFSFLSERQLRALVAYLNRLGNQQTASTDLMIPGAYLDMKQRARTGTRAATSTRRSV